MIHFPKKNFIGIKEQGIREEIIAPLLKYLGYEGGTGNPIWYGHHLKYPKKFIGHKNAQRDPDIVGEADYILSAGNKVNWVIEAKNPKNDIGDDDIEQAYSYANHPEVRAVIFALCNGAKLSIYQTNHGPNVGPILEIKYEDFEEKKLLLFNLLSPEAILNLFPEIKPDVGQPLASGIGSVVEIIGGNIAYEECSDPEALLTQIQVPIIGGSIQRIEGEIIGFVETRAGNRIIEETLRKLKLTSFEMKSSAALILPRGDEPANFSMERRHIIFPKGEKLVDPKSGREFTIPYPIENFIEYKVQLNHVQKKLVGVFNLVHEMPQFGKTTVARGSIEIWLR